MIYASTGQSFEARLVGAPSGLVGTVGVRILDNVGGVVSARTTAGIIEDPAGSGSYAKTLTAPGVLGQFAVLWDTDPGGVASPTNSSIEDLVVISGSTVHVTPSVGQDGNAPCSLWTSPTAVKERYADLSAVPDGDLLPAIVMAGEVLYEISGRRFRGVCTRTVRPCRNGCGCWFTSNGILYNWGRGIWYSEVGDRCGCGCVATVRLSYPVQEIISVAIDGVVVDPATYRVDGRRDLVRLRDHGGWPSCQNMDLPSGVAGTFEVTYSYGRMPPALGVEAANQIASEFYKATHPEAGNCALPPGVTQVIRQGVTVTRALKATDGNADDMFGSLSVLPLVATFLRAYNPKRILRRPSVWSPDLQRPARKVR